MTINMCKLVDCRNDTWHFLTHELVHTGVGEVHDGLWAGLHQADPDGSAGALVVDRIMDCLLNTSSEGKPIYMCGHSLGGGLISMLSLILPTR